MEYSNEVIGMVIAAFTKTKIYIYGIITAIFSGAIKYLQRRRKGEKATFKGFISFSIIACAVTITALVTMQFFGMEINAFAYAVTFWLGLSTEFIYNSIQKYIEKLTTNYINKK